MQMFKIARVYGFIALEAESLRGTRRCLCFCFCLSVAVIQYSDKGHLREVYFGSWFKGVFLPDEEAEGRRDGTPALMHTQEPSAGNGTFHRGQSSNLN